MSSPATAAYKAAWFRSGRDAATLVKVELTDPSALTLYLSTREVSTPGAPRQVWQDVLADVESIVAEGDLLESGPSLCSGGFTVLDRTLAHQSGTLTARSVFASHRWIGATVTIYFWEASLTSFADALQVFKGTIQNYEDRPGRIEVRLLQRHDFNREVGTAIVSRDRYARAPEESLGKTIPIIYGSRRGIEMRAPITSSYGDVQHWFDRIRGGRRLAPGVIVDAGGGGAGGTASKTKVLFASHPCKTFADVPAATGYLLGAMPYLQVDGRLCMLDPPVADVINDATDGTGMVIADSPVGGPDPLTALFPIHPIQVELVAVNNAENPRALLDPLNETSYCRLDYDAGLREVRVRLPTLGSPGDIVRFDAEIIYRSVGSTANVAFRLLNTVTGLQTSILSLTGSATPRAEGFGSTLGWGGGGGWPANPWQFGDSVLVVDFNAASAGVKVDIFAVGLSCQFRPKRDVLGVFTTTETAYAYFHDRPNFFERVIRGEAGTLRVVPYQVTKEQSVTAIRRSFFCNIEGYADDGSGTYTGLAAGLIERAPDIAQHLLVTYGGQTTAQIERGVGVFGSFVDARAKLKTWHQADMVHALAITEKTDLIRVLAALAEDAACWIYLSRFDDNFHCIPWKAGAAVDFDRTLTKYDLAGKAPVIVMTPDTRVMVGIRVPYGFDYPSGRYLQETLVGSARSLAGHRWRGLRDQQLSVIASGTGQNNKLDFTVVGAGAFTATLATGDYTGPTMRTEVQAAMQAARPDDWVACFGPLVVGGVNAKLQIQEFEGAQNIKIATIAASSYATMEALGTATQSALNAVSSGFTVSYSRVSRKYTISRSPNNFRIGDINAVPSDHFASVLLGYGRATTAYAAFHVAAFEREEDVFAIGNVTRDVELNWETGANGLTAGLKNCAALLGFDSTRDSAGGQGSQVGISPKGTLEQALEAARSKYGAKRESSVGGQSIFDSGTARELRNRIADLGRVARPAIILESDYLPDMERGRVFEFDASVDDLKRYAVEGTDGSWAGKKFQATKVIQHAGGDSYLTEVVAVEISAA